MRKSPRFPVPVNSIRATKPRRTPKKRDISTTKRLKTVQFAYLEIRFADGPTLKVSTSPAEKLDGALVRLEEEGFIAAAGVNRFDAPDMFTGNGDWTPQGLTIASAMLMASVNFEQIAANFHPGGRA